MKLRTLFYVFIAAIVLASCGSKGGKTGLLVPKDAVFAFHLDGASLSSKIDMDELRKSAWFQDIIQKMQEDANTDSTLKNMYKDPEGYGTDTKADVAMFAVIRGSNLFSVFNGKLKDAAKFDSVLKQYTRISTPSVKDGISSLPLRANTSVSWNKDRWVIVLAAPLNTMGGNNSFGMEDVTVSKDTLFAYGQEVLELKGSKLLDADSKFANLVGDGKDMHIWFNLEAYFNQVAKRRIGMMTMMGNIGDIVKGNIATYSINFDKGKITADSRHYYGDKMSSLFKKYEGKPVTADKAELLPADNVVVAAAINYQPAFFKELIGTLGLDGLMNMLTAQSGFSIDDFVKANAGDILFALSDLQSRPATDSTENGKPDISVTFGTSVKDKVAFDNLITLLWQRSHSEKSEFTYKLENNWFVVSNKPANVDRIISGKGSKAEYTEKITGHPLGVYVNIQRLIEEASKNNKDTTVRKIMALGAGTFRELLVNGGEFTKNYMTMHAELTMADPSTNSLKQLYQLFGNIYLNSKDRLDDLKSKIDQGDVDMNNDAETPLPPPPLKEVN